jgi:hypothetical protein
MEVILQKCGDSTVVVLPPAVLKGLGLSLVAPITQGDDLAARKARKIERVPQAVIDDALGRLGALIDC